MLNELFIHCLEYFNIELTESIIRSIRAMVWILQSILAIYIFCWFLEFLCWWGVAEISDKERYLEIDYKKWFKKEKINKRK